jgi:hypothetical protein
MIAAAAAVVESGRRGACIAVASPAAAVCAGIDPVVSVCYKGFVASILVSFRGMVVL